MKNLKITVVALLFVFAASINVQAQDKAMKGEVKHMDRKGDKIEQLKEELKLTPQQMDKIKEIRASREDQRKALKSKLKALNKAEKEEIKTVLTEEQRAILKEKMAKRKEHKKGMKPMKESPKTDK